jgi:YD repeat-containing protein
VDGEVTGIALGGTPLITQIEWTPFAGAVKRWRWAMASGIKANERYFDLAGRAIRYPLGDALRDVRYDEASRIVSLTHLSADGTAQPALDQAFSYDENDRITSITTNAASWAITYDPNGNRTGLSLNAYTVAATSNRVTGITNPARSFGYDSAGNTTSDTTTGKAGYTATYNLRGQLATLTKNGVTTRYTYNAAGQRVRKVSSTGSDSTVVFVYDQAGHLLGEYGVELFKQLFKDPSKNPGLSREELEAYKEIARRALVEYEKNGKALGILVQQERINIINRYLRWFM